MMEYYETLKRKGILTYSTAWMNLENMLHEINQKQKDKYHNSNYVKYLGGSNSQRQKVEAWLPRVAGRGK